MVTKIPTMKSLDKKPEKPVASAVCGCSTCPNAESCAAKPSEPIASAEEKIDFSKVQIESLIAITNLPPRPMMGMESCGMLLSAVHHEEGEEKLHLLMVDDHISAGAKLY